MFSAFKQFAERTVNSKSSTGRSKIGSTVEVLGPSITGGVPVKFAKPKEGALTWVCGQMLHKDAPKIDSAYDILDSLISQAASTALIRGSGYGGPNRKSYDEFTDEELTNLGLSRNPMEILRAGHFGIPQTAEWDQRMTSTWEQIKLGF